METTEISLLARWPAELFNKLPERTITDLLSALKYSNGERNLKNLLDDIHSGEKQIWVHTLGNEFNATIITQLTEYPGKRTCEILYLGGDKVIDVLHEIREIETWAKEQGCLDIQAIGRKGWVRLLAKHNYEQRYTVIGKEL